MQSIGIRELKEEHASEIVCQVGEQPAEYVITHRGQPVARLAPIARPAPSQADIEAYLAEWDEIAAEIGRRWPAGVSADDVMHDIRREL